MLGTAKCWVGISHKPFEGELLAQWLKDFVQTPFVHIPSTCRPPRKSSLSQFQPSMVPSLTINVSSTFTTCLLCKPGSTLEVYMQRLPGHATLHQRVPEVNLQHVASFACSTCYHSLDIQNNYNRYNEVKRCYDGLCLFQNRLTSSCPPLVTTITLLAALSHTQTPISCKWKKKSSTWIFLGFYIWTDCRKWTIINIV